MASVGDPAPDFTLPSTQGEIALFTRLPALLVFYPGDDTPVCTRQLCDYRDHLDTFSGLGLHVIAINPQSGESHRKFADRHRLPFPVASDAGGRVCRAYGAVNFLGMTRRALVLVGRDGRVRWRRTDFPFFHRTAAEVKAEVERD